MLELPELNQRSAKLGDWEVAVFESHLVEYTWKDKKTGHRKTGTNFTCLLVSLTKPTSYVVAVLAMSGDSAKALEDARRSSR